MVRSGQTAPHFETPEGPLRELWRKGPVVLVFYRGAWCPVCALQMNGFRSRYAEFERLGARIVAVSSDSPGVARAYKAMMRLPFTVVADPGRRAIEAYGAVRGTNTLDALDRMVHPVAGLRDYAQPAVFVIDTRGKVRYARVGADPLDRPSVREVLRGVEEAVRGQDGRGRFRRPSSRRRRGRGR